MQAVVLDNVAPSDAFVFADYHTEQNLRYYFKRKNTYNINKLLLAFYTHSKFNDMPFLKANSIYLNKIYLEQNYDILGYDGYSYQKEWSSFIYWILDVKNADDEKKLLAKNFIMISLESITKLLIINDNYDLYQNRSQILDSFIKNSSLPHRNKKENNIQSH